MGKEKAKTFKKLLDSYSKELLEDYAEWKDIYDNGCQDPAWSDGVNINLKRNHIIYNKNKLEELLGDKFYLYPDCYFFPTPPKLPYNFMAKDREFYGARSEDEKKCNKKLTYEQVMSFDGKKLVKQVYGDNVPYSID